MDNLPISLFKTRIHGLRLFQGVFLALATLSFLLGNFHKQLGFETLNYPDEYARYLSIFFCLCFFGAGFYIKKNTKYISCPYKDCDGSILVNYKWKCDGCKKTQTKDQLITDNCEHCNKEMKTFFCEHCKREFYL